VNAPHHCLYRWFLAVFLSCLVSWGFAATFTVDSTADSGDINPGDGVCSTATKNGVCTLRAAVQEANALAGADAIVFSLAANSAITMTTGTAESATNNRRALTLTESLSIDGAAVPGLTISGGWNSVGGSTVGWGIFTAPTSTTAASRTIALSNLRLINGNPGPLNGGTSNGVANSNGGALFVQGGTVNVNRVTFDNNHANDGSAIDLETGTTVNVTNSTFSNGKSRDDGGGVDVSAGATANFTNTTFAYNRAQFGDNAGTGGTGGALRVDGTANFTYVTMAYNVGAAAGAVDVRGSVSVKNSLVISNTRVNGAVESCSAAVNDRGNNWGEPPNTCGFASTNVRSASEYALSSALANNGGPTQTLALATASVANGAIPEGADCGAGVGTADQRGVARAVGGGCEPGAFELQSAGVSGTLFNDTNRNGAQDAGENAFTATVVTVTLTNTATNQTFTTATTTGSYSFSVPAGSYTVTASAPNCVVTTPARTVNVTANTSSTVQAIGLSQNLTPPPCSTVFAGGAGTGFNIYPVNTTTGAAGTPLFAAPYATAAFARDPATNRFYYIENVSGTINPRIGYYDAVTGQQVALGTIARAATDQGTNSNFTRFAFDASGVGYASISGTNALYRISTDPFSVTRLGVIADLPLNQSGDFAFSASGVLRILTDGVLYRIDVDALDADRVLNTNISDVNGAAFDAAGNFYVSNQTNLYQVDLGTGAVSTARPLSGASSGSLDLASCVYPSLTTTISATKAVSPTGPVAPGTLLSYTVTVTNSGNALATQTVFADVIPANTTYVASSATLNGAAVADVNGAMPYASGGFIQSPGSTYAEGSVGTSAPAVVTFQVRVNDPVPAGTVQVSNQGTVTYSRGPTGGVPTDGDAAAAGTQPTVSPLSLPDLTVAKAAVGSFVRGSSASYTLTVNNVGSAPTSGTLTVTDTLPTGLSYSAATGTGWTCSFDAATQTVTCTCTTAVPAGERAPPLTLNVVAGQTAPASVVNTATVSGSGESNTANNSGSATTAVVSRADLGVVKTKTAPSGNLVPGQTVTYRLVVSNGGPSNVTGFNVFDAVPAALTGVSWTCTAAGVGDCDTLTAGTGGSGSGNAVTLSNAQLNAGGGNTLTITLSGTLSANATGSVTNTATVAAPSGVTDPAAGNNTSSVTTPVQATANLALTKTASSSSPQSGEGVTYTFRVTNSGPSAATNVTVSDALPAGLTLVRTNGCAQDPNGVPSCALGSVAVGAQATFTLTATARGDLGATVTNTASVSATETDPAPQNNTATATVTLSGMTLTKAVCNVTVSGCDAENEYVEMVEAAPEDVLEYRITYLRRGPPVFDVVLTDPVPENNVLTTFPNGAEVVVLCPDASVQNLGQGNPLVVSFNLADVCALGVAPRPAGGSGEALIEGDTGNFRFRVVIP